MYLCVCISHFKEDIYVIMSQDHARYVQQGSGVISVIYSFVLIVLLVGIISGIRPCIFNIGKLIKHIRGKLMLTQVY